VLLALRPGLPFAMLEEGVAAVVLDAIRCGGAAYDTVRG
jgi:hypothetical protein